jgi:hypothetical protein
MSPEHRPGPTASTLPPPARRTPILSSASDGRFGEMWLPVGASYKYVLTDENGVVKVTVDNYAVSSDPPTIAAGLDNFLAGSSASRRERRHGSATASTRSSPWALSCGRRTVTGHHPLHQGRLSLPQRLRHDERRSVPDRLRSPPTRHRGGPNLGEILMVALIIRDGTNTARTLTALVIRDGTNTPARSLSYGSGI